MAQAFGEPAFPVDTHIHRLAARWGLSNGSTRRAHRARPQAALPARVVEQAAPADHLLRPPATARRAATICSRCPICSWAASKARIKAEMAASTRRVHGRRRRRVPDAACGGAPLTIAREVLSVATSSMHPAPSHGQPRCDPVRSPSVDDALQSTFQRRFDDRQRGVVPAQRRAAGRVAGAAPATWHTSPCVTTARLPVGGGAQHRRRAATPRRRGRGIGRHVSPPGGS